jgi:hypothetical protein
LGLRSDSRSSLLLRSRSRLFANLRFTNLHATLLLFGVFTSQPDGLVLLQLLDKGCGLCEEWL